MKAAVAAAARVKKESQIQAMKAAVTLNKNHFHMCFLSTNSTNYF
jgi:hypothetical protein